ncbi:MAG: ABC transporter permease [Butyricimonas faecihominis]
MVRHYFGVLSYLYLYFPLLTMGLMSREFSSGSIKLLYSSPITSTQIVLGKYFSMMLYGLIMLAIVTVYVVFYMFVLKDFDYAVAITGLIGIYLIMCLYSAVGLFVSCLTSYQVGSYQYVAALTILQVIMEFYKEWIFGEILLTGFVVLLIGPIAGLINSGDVYITF